MAVQSVGIKICGLTHVEDVRCCVDNGVDAVGFNRVDGAERYVSDARLIELCRAARAATETIAVVADPTPEAILRLFDMGIDTVQFHGDESPEEVQRWAPRAFKAVRVGGPQDVSLAARFVGPRVLVDARVDGQLGGTGVRVDLELIEGLVDERDVWLAGGLTPDNVAQAIQSVRPHGVDVASGVCAEGQPRRKDPQRIREFVAAVRGA